MFYSRKIWAQNILPLFVMLWAISAALTFVERRPRYILLHLVSLAVVAQIHMAAVALVPATIIFMLLLWKRLNWKLVGFPVVRSYPHTCAVADRRLDLGRPELAGLGGLQAQGRPAGM